MTGPPLLSVRDLVVRFGAVEALRGVSLDVGAGSVTGLIGPNGAGKTTLIDAVSGAVPAAAGTVTLAGVPVQGLPPHRRAGLGLGRTFQSLELFQGLSVAENLQVAAEAGGGAKTAAARPAGDDHRLPAALSTADQSRLALDRALAARPRALLLDEPAAGLDGAGRQALAGRLRRLAEDGMAVLVVDHDMGFLLELCDQVVALDLGRVIAAGPPAAVRRDPAVVASYLGRAPGLAAGPPPAPPAPVVSTPPAPSSAPAVDGPPLLQAWGLTAGYGGAPVVRGIDLVVRAGEVVALLGPNGAGKTTTLRALAGVVPVSAGRVEVLGASGATRADRLARRGLAHVPQGRALFPTLSVREHLQLAGRGRDRAAATKRAVADFPALADRLDQPAGTLSGGEQQMLALARALVAEHRLLLVDELSLGLAPRLVEQLLGRLRQVAEEEGCGVLMVEQHVHLALELADRASVLAAGEVVLEGPAAALAADPEALAASYLGQRR